MTRNKVSILAAAALLSLAVGCQETPEESIVREKGAAGIKKYESMDGQDAPDGSAQEDEEDGEGRGEDSEGREGNPLADLLQAPEHYKNQMTYQDGALVIDTDADVILPDASALNTYSVSAKEVNQDLIDTITKAFFEGDKIYHAYPYQEWTKSKYQEDITRLKKYKAEGNLDPYDYGTDEEGNLMFDIDQVIAKDEEDMKDAPEEITKVEVTPSFGLEWQSGKGDETKKEVDEDSFLGVVETAQGNYSYRISYGLKPDIVVKIGKLREGEDEREFSDWTEAEFLLDNKSVTEDMVKKRLGISYEEAEKAAKEKIDRLGWGLELYGWDYALYKRGEGAWNENAIHDAGYIFRFTRKLDGVPITFTMSYGGGLEDMDSTLTPWCYERCDVIVGDDGIQTVEIYNPYEIGQVQTERVKLMDFDSIAKIYEQMMEISNAEISQFEKQRTYHIRRITLGYSRIYDPTQSSDTGLLVPVWDFFGSFDVITDEHHEENSGEHSTQSQMTINAIDGTVIDRSLGY
ncbi:DUF6034 family protein [Lachnospiraceae bacterium 29-84]